MEGRASLRRQGGFTLIEVLVVLTILFIMAMVGFPRIQQLIIRNKLMGVTRDLSQSLQLARQTAVRTGLPVIAQPDYTTDSLVVFVNVDEDAGFNYDHDPIQPARTTDYQVARVPLPKAQSADANIYFWGPGDTSWEGADAVDGLTPAGSGPNVAVFEPDGSIRDVGAFRIADARGNFFELRIAPEATAQVEVRKYYRDPPPWGGSPDFFPQGKHPGVGDSLWRWYY